MSRSASCGLAALAIFLLALPCRAEKPSEKDRQQLITIKQALEDALERNRPDIAKPYLDSNFAGEMLGQRMAGPSGFQEACDRAARDVKGGKLVDGYDIKIVPDMDKLSIDGDTAAASGTTKERIHTPAGWVEFSSQWTANLVRGPNGWKLLAMRSQFDPSLTISATLGKAVRELWSPIGRLSLRGVRAKAPDYDGDDRAFLNKAP